MRSALYSMLVVTGLISSFSSAQAGPVFDRNSWSNWRGTWGGNLWKPGDFGETQYMTCVGTDGSYGSPEYWSAGMGDQAAREAYKQALDWANVAGRNPAYVEVECGY